MTVRRRTTWQRQAGNGWRYSVAVALLCATTPVLAAACSAGDAALPWRDLYIVAGQSNAAGVASVDDESGLFGRDTRFANVQIYGIHGAPAAVVDHDGQSSAAQVDWSALAGWHVAAPGFGIKSLAYYREFVRPQAEVDVLDGLFGPDPGLCRPARRAATR